jgi:hypothetical protein
MLLLALLELTSHRLLVADTPEIAAGCREHEERPEAGFDIVLHRGQTMKPSHQAV